MILFQTWAFWLYLVLSSIMAYLSVVAWMSYWAVRTRSMLLMSLSLTSILTVLVSITLIQRAGIVSLPAILAQRASFVLLCASSSGLLWEILKAHNGALRGQRRSMAWPALLLSSAWRWAKSLWTGLVYYTASFFNTQFHM